MGGNGCCFLVIVKVGNGELRLYGLIERVKEESLLENVFHVSSQRRRGAVPTYMRKTTL
jgi:hypothetical protein